MANASEHGFESAWIDWVRRRERTLIVGWLVFAALALAIVGYWGVARGAAERVVDALDSAWVRELDPIAARIKAGDHLGAAAALERLDADCPATFVKHRYDRERERLLALLAQCYVALDRRADARATLARLVAFDPRNFANHFALAEAERSFGDELAAKPAYLQVLALHPSHLPSVRALTTIEFDAGNHAAVVAAFERYVDSWLLARVQLKLGSDAIFFEVPIDGRSHVIELPTPLPRAWRGGVCVETEGFSMRVEQLAFVPPMRTGIAEKLEPFVLQATDAWTAAGGTRTGPGELAANSLGARLCTPDFELAAGAAAVRIELALFKTLPADLLDRVGRSYEALLAHDRLALLRDRLRVGGFESAGTVLVE